MNDLHPARILHPAGSARLLPVCDHYCGVEKRILKALALQRDSIAQHGQALFDVTLDCEDGAPAGQEREHAQMVADLALQAVAANASARVALRVHPVDHPAFADDVGIVLGQAGAVFSHVMLPKIEAPEDVARALVQIDAVCSTRALPIHILLESPAALLKAAECAALERVESISFGLMDYVSAFGGAIPAEAMSAQGQFSHPLVLQAKLQIAQACHARGKTPAHCVVTEFTEPQTVAQAARKAARELGYTRMWSIHPAQIEPILAAFAPDAEACHEAGEILMLAQQARWAPIRYQGRLHDRASYRYYWQLLQRARNTGQTLPAQLQQRFF